MNRFLVGVLGLAVAFAGGGVSAESYLDAFDFSMNADGTWSGGGSGYPYLDPATPGVDGQGEWYEYGNTNWINQWFYDGYYRPTYWKEVWIGFEVVDASGALITDPSLLPFEINF